MLQLKNIVKEYGSGDTQVHALNGINIAFRENEFVAILGHSGCGKTTMLNIIGGLDHYTSGDLIINGVSTKEYKDRDWDAYRNHTIGFIFQSYNLIPHQTVLANVELALTISGVSKAERRKRAKEALEKVGLGNQLHKRPNQMSGGQMQRVAIARALINNPDVLLADEPTGALDSETSVQVMELLKEIAKDKLVIMVTHNPELAEQYATRIVRIKDGLLTDDSNEFKPEKEDEEVKAKKQRVSMSLKTAVSLSLNNLMTKKGRTILTSFAGSIGIIGIALILSLSTGINAYINNMQEETLSSYPLQINRESTDTGALLSAITGNDEDSEDEDETVETKEIEDKVYSNTLAYKIFNTLNSSAKQINNMKDFKTFLETDEKIAENMSAIAYSYDIQMPIFTKDSAGQIVSTDFMTMYANAFMANSNREDKEGSSSAMGGMGQMHSEMGMTIWEELLPNEDGKGVNDLVKNQYDLVYGQWPESYNEVIMVLDDKNRVPDIMAYALGFKERDKFAETLKTVMSGETVEDYGETEWSFEDVVNHDYKMILPCEYYQKNIDGTYTNLTETDAGLEFAYNSEDIGTNIKIVGFVKPNEDSSAHMINGVIGYTADLSQYVLNKTNDSDIVKEQLANEDVDVFTGTRFLTDEYTGPTLDEKYEIGLKYVDDADVNTKADIYRFIMSSADDDTINNQIEEMMKNFDRSMITDDVISGYAAELGVDVSQISGYLNQMSDEELKEFARQTMAEQMKAEYAKQVQLSLSTSTNEDLARALDEMIDVSDFDKEFYAAICDEFTPAQVSNSTFEMNEKILGVANLDDPTTIRIYAKTFEAKDNIASAIKEYNKSAKEEDVIHYTDYIALLLSSVTSIISGISYLLIAFVGISLVVSSIMIGIITYISVLERTREIGILRAIGASKRDVSRVFNAETALVGLTAGLIGIGVSFILTIPINLIIHNLTSLDTLNAQVPINGAIALVLISVILTLISGLIPSRVASKKDPVEALRTD